MAVKDYTYPLTDFLNDIVSIGSLKAEIEASSIVTALAPAAISADATECIVWFKIDLSAEDKTTLDGLVAAHTGVSLDDGADTVQLEGNQTDGAQRVFAVGREGTDVIRASHNLADATTWYRDAVEVTGEELATSDTLLFGADHPNIIDSKSGGFHKSYEVTDRDVTVYVDAVEATIRSPFLSDWTVGSEEDCYLDYAAGEVHFRLEQTGTVTMDYWYANGSTWVLEPYEGRILSIESAEVQFSADSVMNDSLIYEVYGLVEVFAPAMMGEPYNLPAGTKIPIADTKYETVRQVIDEAKGAYPVIPAMGGPLRGCSQDTYGFPFWYGTIRDLHHSMGMDLRCRLQDDIEFGGEVLTATFYCICKPE